MYGGHGPAQPGPGESPGPNFIIHKNSHLTLGRVILGSVLLKKRDKFEIHESKLRQTIQ